MADASSIKGLEQVRAKFAYECAKEVVEFNFIDSHSEGFDSNLFQKYLQKKFIKDNDSDSEKNQKRQEITTFLQSKSGGQKISAKDFKESIEKFGKEYKSYAKKLPMMIKTNGLGAALAFSFSKGKDGNAWELLFNHIQDWLRQDHKKWLLGDYAEHSLETAAISLNSSEYRALTTEILAFLNWLRRFAEGLIEGEAEED